MEGTGADGAAPFQLAFRSAPKARKAVGANVDEAPPEKDFIVKLEGNRMVRFTVIKLLF